MLRAATMLGATAMNCGGAAMTAVVTITAAAMLAAAITCRHASRSFAAAALSRRQMRLARSAAQASALRSPRGSTQHCESEVLTCNAAVERSVRVCLSRACWARDKQICLRRPGYTETNCT